MAQNQPGASPNPLTELERAIRENMPPPGSNLHLPVLADRADRLLGVLGIMNTWVSEIDEYGSMTFTSPHVEDLLGFTPEECLTTPCIQFHPDDLPRVVAAGRAVRKTGEPAKNQTRMRHKLGHWVWIETSLLPWTNAAGEYRTITACRDITELKRAEALRRESEARYRVVSQMSCDLITEMDAQGHYTYIGPGSKEILGYTVAEMLELEAWALIHPEDRERVAGGFEREFEMPPQSHYSSSPPTMLEARIQHRDGHWMFFEAQGVTYVRADGATRYLAVSRDVSERVRAERAQRAIEERMQRTQKLESLGVLAGGIAHDFNNLLTPIMGAAGLGLAELPDDSPLRARLKTIHTAARRAASLTNQMLAYAGQKPLRVEHLDLSALIQEMHDLATSSVSGRTAIDLQLKEDLPFVEGEAAQLSQIIMNLISNGAEALAEGSGQLAIRTGIMCLDERPADLLFGETMSLGEHVYFEVTDTGCGMDRETLDKIFDPFYTTKFTGRGLGLAAVAGIVRGHRGGIKVESQPGRGTCFRVLFPAVDRPEVPLPAAPEMTADFRSNATVLVIDDDEGVREFAAEVLRRAGMTVLKAADGHEGVKLFEIHGDEIGVVLLDRTMPSLSGADTFEAIRALRDDAKIVLVSGYSQERVAAELGGRGIDGFLKKPFLPEVLLTKVQESLKPEA